MVAHHELMSTINSHGLSRWQSLLSRVMSRLYAAGLGERNVHLNKAAYHLGQRCAALGGTELEARQQLLTAGLALGLRAKEAQGTVASGLRDGLASPVTLAPISTAPPADLANQQGYPPQSEVRAQLAAAWAIQVDSDVGRYLSSRGIGPGKSSYLGMAYQPGDRQPGAKWWPISWYQRYPLMVPLYDHSGRLRSIHARAITDIQPKTRLPWQCSAKGLVMADPVALAILRGEGLPQRYGGLVVAEGLTDTLTWAATCWMRHGHGGPWLGTLGYLSGSASALERARARIPTSKPIYVHMDQGRAGDRYCAVIAAALPGHDLRYPGR